jgi:hypothetical protein
MVEIDSLRDHFTRHITCCHAFKLSDIKVMMDAEVSLNDKVSVLGFGY